jgi:hypothetical protein
VSAELQPLTPTTDQRAKMAYVYIRQSSLMQVTRHGESTELQYSLVQRAVALGWPRERVELIDEDLGKIRSTCGDPWRLSAAPCRD